MKRLEDVLWNLTYQMDTNLLDNYTYNFKIDFTVSAVCHPYSLVKEYMEIL